MRCSQRWFRMSEDLIAHSLMTRRFPCGFVEITITYKTYVALHKIYVVEISVSALLDRDRSLSPSQIEATGRGFEAANAALNVFNSLSTGVDVCVLSNGVLLES